MKTLLTILALSATILHGQSTTSSHSGWNFDDTLQTAKLIVVADILEGAATDSGSMITVHAKLRVVRTLQGNAVMGASIPVTWQYTPGPADTPAAIAKAPQTRAIFFLRPKGDSMEALQASQMGGEFGGYIVAVPTAPLSGDLFYTADAKLSAKLASEFASALDDLMARKSSDFGPQKLERINPAAPPEFVRTRMQYHGLTRALTTLDKQESAVAMRHLSASADVNLRLLGILGRIRNNDPAAVTELERDLPRLAKGFDAGMASSYLMEFDWNQNGAATLAFGRMALAETTLQGLDGIFAMRVSRNSSFEVMPYLAAMLRSPDVSPRDMAMTAMCRIARNSGKYWKREMDVQCPSQTPVPDRQTEQSMLRYWTDWWMQIRDNVSKTVSLPDVAIPTRYNRRVPDVEMVQVPVEVRFEGLVHMSRAQASHSHDANGEISEQAPEPHDLLSGRLSASDQEIFRAAIAQAASRLDGIDERMNASMNAARQQGAAPNRESMSAAYQQRLTALKEGLSALQEKLSPDGRAELERFLKQMGGASMRSVAAH